MSRVPRQVGYILGTLANPSDSVCFSVNTSNVSWLEQKQVKLKLSGSLGMENACIMFPLGV